MEDKTPTGIEGLDELVGGGFPKGRSIVVSGGCGTGKTTFGMQYLVNGIKNGENGILLTLEQHADELRADAKAYGLDIKKYEDAKQLIIIDTSLSRIGIKDYLTQVPTLPDGSFSLLPNEFDINRIVKILIEAAKSIDAKRVVVDSLPALDYMISESVDLRRALIHINYELKNQGLTTLLITEALEDDNISKHGVEEYIADGVIILRANEALDTRTIKIRKMRTSKHTLKPTTFELTSEGFKIKKNKVF
ncbi:RAD55 family ATPase [Candidatus Altiarchaeota archaeon]